MKLTLTDEQHDAAFKVWNDCPRGSEASLRAAIESIEIPDTLPTLRPIAEMPEEVPDGCQRIGWDKECGPCEGISIHDTHFIDIFLPTAPVDANRSSFESALKQSDFHDFRRDGDGYVAAYANAAWNGWKLCNETKKGAQP